MGAPSSGASFDSITFIVYVFRTSQLQFCGAVSVQTHPFCTRPCRRGSFALRSRSIASWPTMPKRCGFLTLSRRSDSPTGSAMLAIGPSRAIDTGAPRSPYGSRKTSRRLSAWVPLPSWSNSLERRSPIFTRNCKSFSTFSPQLSSPH